VLSRLLHFVLSDYNRMVLSTIGVVRFFNKPYYRAVKFYRFFLARLIRPKSCSYLPSESQPLSFSGKWFFGSSASLDFPSFISDKQRVLDLASKAKDGIFFINGKILDIKAEPFNGRFDVDPLSGTPWPQTSVFSSRYEGPGDIRYPWELGRLHQLVWFGQAWRYTKDPDWIQVGMSQLEQLLGEASYEYGVHWRDGLQIAVRIYSLIAFVDLCHDAPNKKIFSTLNNVIKDHLFALKRQLSTHSEITNNHAIGEACALALAGLYLNDNCYLNASIKRLKVEVRRQIYPDGVPYEGSIPYIRFDLDFMTLLCLAFKAAELDTPAWLIESVEHIATSLSSLVDSKGGIPPIGDGDDARVIRFDDEPYLIVNESLHLASRIVKKPLATSPSLGSFMLWTVGSLGEEVKKSDDKCVYMPDSGLFHLNQDKLDVWVDCGPTGYGLSGPGGHGHNDTTAIVVHHDGHALLHDPGWYTYYGDRVLRDKLRSTFSHNTIRINDQEQARLGGMFEIIDDCKPTSVKIKKLHGLTSLICGHTGFSRIDKSIEYRRIISINRFSPWVIRVTDIVNSKVPLKIDSHLGSDFPWRKISDLEWGLLCKHTLKLRSGFQDVKLLEAPYSKTTGVLEKGSALEWSVPSQFLEERQIFRFVTRWELNIYSIGD
jgi:hypothetical protein